MMALRGHSGITATCKRIETQFYWLGLKQDVTNIVR